jgi:hypothetical protein
MTTPTPVITPPLTWDEHVAKMNSRGFKWVRSDDVVIHQDVAEVALLAIDNVLARKDIYGTAVTEVIEARDALQTAICVAVEAS